MLHKLFGWEIRVVPKVPPVKPLRVRVMERAEELRESILNKELERIGHEHELTKLYETRRFLEEWLAKVQDEQEGVEIVNIELPDVQKSSGNVFGLG